MINIVNGDCLLTIQKIAEKNKLHYAVRLKRKNSQDDSKMATASRQYSPAHSSHLIDYLAKHRIAEYFVLTLEWLQATFNFFQI